MHIQSAQSGSVCTSTLVTSADGSRIHHIKNDKSSVIRYNATSHCPVLSFASSDPSLQHHASSTRSSATLSEYSPSPSPRPRPSPLTGAGAVGVVGVVVCSRAGQRVACGVGGNESGGETGEDERVRVGVAKRDDWRDVVVVVAVRGVRSDIVVVVVVLIVVGTISPRMMLHDGNQRDSGSRVYCIREAVYERFRVPLRVRARARGRVRVRARRRYQHHR